MSRSVSNVTKSTVTRDQEIMARPVGILVVDDRAVDADATILAPRYAARTARVLPPETSRPGELCQRTGENVEALLAASSPIAC